jgi:RimJ/RimL family protein N-acetyltransferase
MAAISVIESFGSYTTRVTRALTELAELYCRVFRYPAERAREIEWMINEERRNGHVYLVRLVNERLVGFISYRLDVPEGNILAELFHIGCLITPSVPGGGMELIEAMGRHLGAKHGSKLHCVFLRTHASNIPARRLYERCGFWPVAMLPGHFRSGVDEIVYQKLYNVESDEQERLERWSRSFEEQLAAF